MSFVELSFLVFLPVVLVAYFLLDRWLYAQNALILAASLFFYGWWDWRFLALVLITLLVGYCAGIGMERFPKHARRILLLAVIFLLVELAVFKYANFFIDSFIQLMAKAGFNASVSSLSIILPIGISFYTFQKIAYLADIERGVIRAERDLIRFGAFVTFFPQLVAGPIERAQDLLTQFACRRIVTTKHISQGMWLIVYGYFMKVGIADVVARNVEIAFVADQPSGWWTIMGTYAFGLQIYGDFLGYSLIAKGVALLFGIELTWNFNFPYWSTSISDFWRRWHISLSRWLRDYLYIPLGGSRVSNAVTVRNLMVAMTLGGLWHGASWAFVLWGMMHGAALSIHHMISRHFPANRVSSIAGWLVTMLVVFVGWFLFRVRSTEMATSMIAALANFEWYPAHTGLAATLAISTGIIGLLEFAQIRRNDRYFVLAWNPWLRAMLFALMTLYTLVVSRYTETQFIYFQF